MRWYRVPSQPKLIKNQRGGHCKVTGGYVGHPSIRRALAAQLRQFSIALCCELLSDSPLSDLYKSGTFVAGRPIKTSNTFLFNSLAKRLRSFGARVAHVEAKEFCGTDALRDLNDEIWAQTGNSDQGQAPTTLTEAFRYLTYGGATVVLLIENIDVWSDTAEGWRALRALKSCRDAVNLAEGRVGKLLIVGIGEPAKMVIMTRDGAQAFYAAALVAVPGYRDQALALHPVEYER